MAEHLPLRMHAALADFLARHVGGLLIFAAGVPGEPGIGHVGNRPLKEWQRLFEARGLVHLPRTSTKLRGTARNVDNRKNLQAFAARSAPLGKGWDDDPDLRKNMSASRRRPGFPPEQFRWLETKECAGAVRVGIEANGRDLCNATHSVSTVEPGSGGHHRTNASVALPSRMTPSGVIARVPWLTRHRLRQGELALWPELVVEQAKCFSYLPTARKRLDVAARLGVVGLEDWKPKDEQQPQPSRTE